jgi:hypothetical protein
MEKTPNDLFQLTRSEIESVIKYLAERPAKEVFGLLQMLTSKKPALTEEKVETSLNN